MFRGHGEGWGGAASRRSHPRAEPPPPPSHVHFEEKLHDSVVMVTPTRPTGNFLS
ncbi:hypothetical protein CRUP_008029, partial [Coryphaenoides rupestris]